jgi:hypothetical protein
MRSDFTVDALLVLSATGCVVDGATVLAIVVVGAVVVGAIVVVVNAVVVVVVVGNAFMYKTARAVSLLF